MRNHLLTLALVTLFSQVSIGQSLKKEYQAGIIKIIACLKNNRKEQLADLVAYPLQRQYPLPPVKNKKEFLARFDEIFDNPLKRLIIESKPANDWSEVGWRGIMLHQGDVWVDRSGIITAINYQSQVEVARKKQLIEADKKKLYSSLSSFKAPLYVLETKKFRIRIDELSNGRYRYASWPLSKSMGEKPDLIMTNGELFFEGSGGNHRIEFRNAGYLYICSINKLGTENSPDAVLTIYKGKQEILSQDAQLIQDHK